MTRFLMVLVLILAVLAAAGLAAVAWMTRMPGRSHAGDLPPLTALELAIRDRTRVHLQTLAGEIGERNVWRPEALDAAARYIAESLMDAGYAPVYDEFTVNAAGEGAVVSDLRVKNVVAELKGSTKPEEVIVLGAHYDTVRGCPGANDNASGVAALLELARCLRTRPLARTVRFVAFVNEESPFFGTEAMGSLRYARALRERGQNVRAMFSLETLGYYVDGKGTQRYPDPVAALYPSSGDFVAFVGNLRSSDLVRRAAGSFRRHAHFPAQGAALPELIHDIGRSDHWAFWRQGYPALMVTDTAPFRYPYYHAPTDTPDQIPVDRLARVIAGLARVVEDLAY